MTLCVFIAGLWVVVCVSQQFQFDLLSPLVAQVGGADERRTRNLRGLPPGPGVVMNKKDLRRVSRSGFFGETTANNLNTSTLQFQMGSLNSPRSTRPQLPRVRRVHDR